jgi:hypothetical protein
MWLGDAPVIDNDGLHAYQEKSVKLKLNHGDYPFKVVMFEQGGAERLTLAYELDGGTRQLVPAEWLWSKTP